MKTFGYTFSKKDKSVTGEQNVLRYSALDCWLKSKDSYRKRYYEGMTFSSPEMVFGHEVHKMMEDKEEVAKHPMLSQLPRYEKSEHNIEVALLDFRIGGCLDSYDPKEGSLLDYKSSHKSKDGKIPWDGVRVQRHMQLVFYSVLVHLKYGKVDPSVLLIWIETAFKNKDVQFAGHTLSGTTRELELTGKFQVFRRRIFKWELETLQKLIIASAAEISADFEQYKKNQT